MRPTTTTSFDLSRFSQQPPSAINITSSSLTSSTTPLVILPNIHITTSDSYFNGVTLTIALFLIALSLISILLVLHLQVKSRTSRRLHRFTFHSSSRILFATLVFLWAVTEILRLPNSRIKTLIPSFPTLTLTQQAHLCEIQTLLSLGVFEPGFLIGLLFLVNIPVTETQRHRRRRWSSNSKSWSLIWSMVGSILIVCIPITAVFYIILVQLPNWVLVPNVFVRTAVRFADLKGGKELVLCAIPLAGEAVFGVFSLVYSIMLLLSCWRVISLAINKRLRLRIHVLGVTVLVCLAVQVVMSSVSVIWYPEEMVYYIVVFVEFLCVCVSAAVGECVLVIVPIGDALSVDPTLGVEEAAALARQDACENV